MQVTRQNHSSALLLPDGRVLSAGGGVCVGYGTPFVVASPDASSVSKVALVRLGVVTHSVDMEQRYVPLAFKRSGETLRASGPPTPNVAPPGVYMLVVVDGDRVPSAAKMVRVEDPGPEAVAAVSPAAGAVGLPAAAPAGPGDAAAVEGVSVARRGVEPRLSVAV